MDITTAVLDKHQQLDDVLEGTFGGQRFAALDQRDRAFVRLLATTVLRRLRQLDDALDALVDRPLPARLTRVKSALRLGAAQLLFLGTPPHAAVDQAVRLVGRKSPFKGLVNAVLRRLSHEAATILARQDAARLNTPDWLWNSWRSAYGEAQTRAIAETHLSEPPLDFSVKSDAQTWEGRLGATLLPTGSLRRTGGGLVEDLCGYAEGAWWIQDTAAATPARLLLASLDREGARTRVLDACAAPGGKTAQLAAAGTAVDALDISSSRLSMVEANLRRLHLEANIIEGDLRSWRPPEPYPAILVDAPCSSTGTIRRHPDILHLRRYVDVERLAALQSQLLDSASRMLAPHGFLIYCTCSLQPEEGVDQIRRILEIDNDLERWPISPVLLPGFEEAIRPDGDVQILPHQLADFGGTDGFFISRLRRKA